MAVSKEWLDNRIASTQTQIENLETALESILSGAVTSYEIDTGQGRQRVTKENISSLQTVLDGLYNRVSTLNSMRCRNGVHTSIPGF